MMTTSQTMRALLATIRLQTAIFNIMELASRGGDLSPHNAQITAAQMAQEIEHIRIFIKRCEAIE